MADDGVHGGELWRTDGTAAGTTLVKDILPGAGNLFLFEFTVLGGFLYFATFDEVNESAALWRTDGTSAGTTLVKDIDPEMLEPEESWLTVLGGFLYFRATDATAGSELWRIGQATPPADLTMAKTGPTTTRVGTPFAYTLTVTNHGPNTATGITTTDTMPAGVNLGTSTASQGTCAQASGTVTCQLGSLVNGASATVTIDVTPTGARTLTNTASVSGNETDPNPADNSDTSVALANYVALGDSLSSGEGTPPYDAGGAGVPGSCHRSSEAYGRLLARSNSDVIHSPSVNLQACSGARIDQVLTDGATDAVFNFGIAKFPDTAQIDALDPDADLVTLSIGVNDVGFAGVLATCLVRPDCSSVFPLTLLERDIALLYESLKNVYRQIQTRTSASLFVVGYPRPFCEDVGYAVPGTDLGISGDEANWINDRADDLNNVIEAAVEAAGVHYVDIATDFSNGHQLCNGAGSWMNGLVLDPVGPIVDISVNAVQQSFHPNATGQNAIRRAVEAAGALELPGNKPCAPASCPDNPPPVPSILGSFGEAAARVIDQGSAFAAEIFGTGFRALANVRLTLFSDPVDLGTVQADSNGVIHTTVPLPAGIEPGLHLITAEGTGEDGTARFLAQSVVVTPTLTVSTSGDGAGTVTGTGISCGPAQAGDCAETVTEATQIVLTATPSPGSIFDGFTGGGCTTSPCTVTVDADKAVEARFTRVTVPGGFTSLTPDRLLDTRFGNGAPTGKVAAGSTTALQVAGRGGVPASGVSSVILNVTVTAPAAGGFVTVHGNGTARPNTSSLNFAAAQTVGNLVVAPLGADGKVALYLGSSGATHVIADVFGWFKTTPTTSGSISGTVTATSGGAGSTAGPATTWFTGTPTGTRSTAGPATIASTLTPGTTPATARRGLRRSGRD